MAATAGARKQEQIKMMQETPETIKKIILPIFKEFNQETIDLIIKTLSLKPRVEAINLSYNQIDEESLTELIRLIGELPCLERLNLSRILTEATVIKLSQILSKVPRLTLSGNQLTGSSLETLLLSATNLTHLNLNNNLINDDDCRLIANLLSHGNLKSLSLRRNQFTDQGVNLILEALKWNSSLTHLDLSGNHLTDKTATKLADVLERNNTLCKLSLTNNSITDQGLSYIAEALKNNTGLRSLSLLKNDLTDKSAVLIVQCLDYNYSLTACKLKIRQNYLLLTQALNAQARKDRRNKHLLLQSKSN